MGRQIVYYSFLWVAIYQNVENQCQLPWKSSSYISVILFSEVAKVLDEKFGGTFVNCLKQAEGSAQKLLTLVLDNFPCFRDVATFNGKKVSLLKRAQVGTRVLRWPEIFGVSSFAKIELTGITTGKNLMKINRGFERPKLSRNLPEIFPKMLTEINRSWKPLLKIIIFSLLPKIRV